MRARMPPFALGGVFLAVAVFAEAASAPATGGAGTRPDSRVVVRVATAEELVKALGPDRIIEMAAGTYNLSDVKRGVGVNYKWQDGLGDKFEYELVVRDAANLSIRGVGKEPAHIMITLAYATVLTFQKCTGLELLNLKMGHAAGPAYCTGGVIKGVDCQGMRVERCVLYGSGIHGLELENVRQFALVESIVEDCSYGLMIAKECDGMRFEKSVFRQCREFYGFDFKDCTKVEWADCTVADNAVGSQANPLFMTNLSDKEFAMRFTGGAIRHNSAMGLVNEPEMLVVEKATVEGNAWQAAPQVQKARGTLTTQANGSSVYTADVGSQSWDTIACRLWGNGERAGALRAANPLVKEPIWPDTKIIIPNNWTSPPF